MCSNLKWRKQQICLSRVVFLRTNAFALTDSCVYGDRFLSLSAIHPYCQTKLVFYLLNEIEHTTKWLQNICTMWSSWSENPFHIFNAFLSCCCACNVIIIQFMGAYVYAFISYIAPSCIHSNGSIKACAIAVHDKIDRWPTHEQCTFIILVTQCWRLLIDCLQN